MGSLADLYSNNVSTILTTLQSHTTLARHELADLTGLTRTTVSRAIAELTGRGIVREVEYGAASPRGGRRPIHLKINDDAFAMIGIDLRREKISGCIVHLGGRIASTTSLMLPSVPSQKTVLDSLDSVICHLKQAAQIPIMGIGVGSIGPVDHDTGVIKPQNFECMYDVALGRLLGSTHKLPVSVRTGACVAAIGEYFSKRREGIPVQSLAFVVIDYGGIGLGMISDDSLWTSNGGFGELGHTTIDYNGRECECGRKGCLSTYASGKAALKRLAEITEGNTPEISLAQLAEQAESGNRPAQHVLTEAGYFLGYGVKDLDTILHPEYIVVGSSHPYLEKWYMEGLRLHIGEIDTGIFDSTLAERINVADSGSLAIAYGAATMQIRQFFDSPLPIIERLAHADLANPSVDTPIRESASWTRWQT